MSNTLTVGYLGQYDTFCRQQKNDGADGFADNPTVVGRQGAGIYWPCHWAKFGVDLHGPQLLQKPGHERFRAIVTL